MSLTEIQPVPSYWSRQDEDSDLPTLINSSSSETDSDEDDYRQLEQREDARPGVQSPSEASPPSSLAASPGSAPSAGLPAAGVAPEAHASAARDVRREYSSDSLPELVNTSSSENESSSESEDWNRRNVRPRRAGDMPSSAPALPPDSPRDFGSLSNIHGVSNNRYQPAPMSHGRSFFAQADHRPGRPVTIDMIGGGTSDGRYRRSQNSYQMRWNSAVRSRQAHHPPEPRAQAVLQVVGLEDIAGDNLGQGGERRALGPMDVLSSILGIQGLRLGLDPSSDAFADMRDIPLDPIMQVLQASFNLPPQRKPKVCQDALSNVLVVRMSCSDAETTCPISGDTLREGDWAGRMPCGHYFGMDDLFQWLDVSNSCPVCRYELPTDDAEYNSDKHLSLDKTAQATVLACEVADDVIGQRMKRVRDSHDESVLDDSFLSLGMKPRSWTHKHEAALAAAKRAALANYYAVHHASTDDDLFQPQVHRIDASLVGATGAWQHGAESASTSMAQECCRKDANGVTENLILGDDEEFIFDNVLVQVLTARQNEVNMFRRVALAQIRCVSCAWRVRRCACEL